ncbi:MAG TPA: hypothetical protein VNF71_09205 [Acidimicrobiales bacterium]|nr:hypothetical protein [Acidimicrobiales bacterium]
MLALVPAGLLVLVLLGALAVDSAVTYLGQQQLHDALTAAANDAAGAAIDSSIFYREGRVVLDGSEAQTIVCESIDAQHFSQLRDVHVWVTVAGPDITVRGTAVVDGVFGRALPGFSTRTVSAGVDAVAVTGATSGAVQARPGAASVPGAVATTSSCGMP